MSNSKEIQIRHNDGDWFDQMIEGAAVIDTAEIYGYILNVGLTDRRRAQLESWLEQSPELKAHFESVERELEADADQALKMLEESESPHVQGGEDIRLIDVFSHWKAPFADEAPTDERPLAGVRRIELLADASGEIEWPAQISVDPKRVLLRFIEGCRERTTKTLDDGSKTDGIDGIALLVMLEEALVAWTKSWDVPVAALESVGILVLGELVDSLRHAVKRNETRVRIMTARPGQLESRTLRNGIGHVTREYGLHPEALRDLELPMRDAWPHGPSILGAWTIIVDALTVALREARHELH